MRWIRGRQKPTDDVETMIRYAEGLLPDSLQGRIRGASETIDRLTARSEEMTLEEHTALNRAVGDLKAIRVVIHATADDVQWVRNPARVEAVFNLESQYYEGVEIRGAMPRDLPEREKMDADLVELREFVNEIKTGCPVRGSEGW